MHQSEYIATVAVFITVGLIVGYLIGKRKQRIARHQVLVERITYDYLQERDELLTSIQENLETKSHSRVMYVVKDYSWNN